MRVLHYVPRWLPPTEGFVAAQVGRSTARAVVVSREPLVPGAPRVGPTASVAAVRSDRALSVALPALAALTRADLVHVHFGYRLRDVRHLIGRRPVVVSLHGHDVTAFPRRWPSYYRGVLDRVDAVVVQSRWLADRAVAAGARPDRVHVVPAGVDTGFFGPTPLPPGRQEVLFVGRLVEKKGVDVLLAAWPAVRAAVPQARLRVVGGGPLEPAVRAAAGDGVDLVLRAVDREGVRSALRRSTVVCTPSRTAGDGDAESLLLVNLEAQASGRPVVTTRHGGIPEFVAEGRTALVVEEGDPAALAQALSTLLTDRVFAERMAAAGPAHAATHDVTACAARVDAQVYRPLTGQ